MTSNQEEKIKEDVVGAVAEELTVYWQLQCSLLLVLYIN